MSEKYDLAIVGSRDFNDYRSFCKVLDPIRPKIALIVSGGARGADSLAQRYAKEWGIPILIYYPKWYKFGNKAGIFRNLVVARRADAMLAFTYDYDNSAGTKNAIERMKTLNKPHAVLEFPEPEWRRTAGPDKE